MKVRATGDPWVMREIVAEIDHEAGGGLRVDRLTDENGNDLSWMVDRATLFAGIADLERHLAAELAAPVTVTEA